VTLPPFQISIVSQGWITGLEPDPGDLCSHGPIELTIGGSLITLSGKEHNDYSISTSALLLKRSAIDDHCLAHSKNPGGDLIIHCGTLSMTSCPIGINWNVVHSGDFTRLNNVVRSDSVDRSNAIRFDGLAAELPKRQYRAEVAMFARCAKQPFLREGKLPGDEAQ